MKVGGEELNAAAALASIGLGTHRAPSGKKTERSYQLKNGPARKAELKKEEKLSQRILKKIKRKKI